MTDHAELPETSTSSPPAPPPLPGNFFKGMPPPPSSTDGLSAIATSAREAAAEQDLIVGRDGLVEDNSARRVRVVCISDTHEKHQRYDIPNGDILVHTGDFFSYLEPQGREHFVRAVTELNDFFASLPHRHKIFVAGNHEIAFYHAGAAEVRSLLTNAQYLQDSGCVVEGVKFYGSPWTTLRSMGFPGGSPQQRAARWDGIPADTDVLLTHNPPLGILDLAWVSGVNNHDCKVCGATRHWNKQHWGCPYLRDTVLERVRPLVHAFGHVHDTHGCERHGGVLFINSSMDLKPHPIVFDICVPLTNESSPPERPNKEKKSCCIS